MNTVLITGSSSGIGRATALFFQKKGWNVAATMRSPEKEMELAELPNVKCIALDVESPESVKAAVAAALRDFGSIDAVVNNAGFSLIGPFETTAEDDIRRQFNVNLFGLMNVVREILPSFRERKGGVIVNIASIGGRVGFPMYSLYNSSKFAVEGFSESLQYELKPFGIRIRIVEPGIIKTDFYGRSMRKTHRDDDAVYGAFCDRSIAKLMAMEKIGIGPQRVAKTIWRAAKSKGRRLRYSVGADAKTILGLRRFLPYRLARRILEGMTT